MRLSRLVALAAALLPTAIVAPAAATTLEVPTQGFALTVAPPGARICRVVPRDLDGAEGCAGLDLQAIEGRLAAQKEKVTGLVVMRFPDATVVLTLVAQPGLKVLSSEQLAGFFKGVQSSLPGNPPLRGSSGWTYDVVKLNGVDVAKGSFLAEVPKEHPMYATSASRIYLFAAESGAVTAMFATDGAHSAALASVADGIAATVSMSHAGVADFGKSRDYFIGRLVGAALVPLGGLVAVIVLVMRGRRREEAARAERRGRGRSV